MSSVANQNHKTHWRSFAELNDAPQFRAFLEAEFPTEADPQGLSRRRWLQLMGASLALAGVSGCRLEQQEILPLADRPVDRTPGDSQQFATVADFAGVATGLMVTCVDGRPIKIEGNPEHPGSRGATDARTQAAILTMYDPERSGHVYRRGSAYRTIEDVRDPNREFEEGQSSVRQDESTWQAFTAALQAAMAAVKSAAGLGLAVLAEADSSPTLASLKQQLLADLPQAQWFEYEAVSDDAERAGSRQAFGRPLRTHLALDQADVIACLDADPLGAHPAAVGYARDFAAGRDAKSGKMSRLYTVESRFTVTGGAADHRLPLRSGQIAAAVGVLNGFVERLLAGEQIAPPVEESHIDRFLRVLADDLFEHRGRSVVTVGPSQPAEVHAAVHRLNQRLENIGTTVTFTELPDAERPAHADAVKSLVDGLNGGTVKTLLILGGNPAYDAPADVDFAAALEKAPLSIHAALYRNETSRRCTWHVPLAHWLESWGDGLGWDGTLSVAQPMIEPLHGGKSKIELLAMLLGRTEVDGAALVRETFNAQAGPERADDATWRRTLHDGLLADSTAAVIDSVDEAPAVELPTELHATEISADDLELAFYADPSVYDGRLANNGWLQEAPDPLTKITWDNAALVGPATARKLGLSDGDVVRLKLGDAEQSLPVCVMPGQAPGSIAVALGYGRTAAGSVGGDAEQGIEVGADIYPLRTAAAAWFAGGLSVQKTGAQRKLAATQDHHAIDTIGMQGRKKRMGQLVREATLAHYRQHPRFAEHVVHHPPLESMWSEHQFDGARWGMSIDLSTCIGCNACMVACQAENNVPIVGRDLVERGREMHWIRVDRYFTGEVDDPDGVAHQPVACQHCELAPCEQVCPVAATVHSSEGLNDMVYNRCIGTRYCGNNCPYKVRRFNYFNYHTDLKDPANEVAKMKYNPEVTVRSRGVMEKCTFCVQRIQAAKIDAKNDRVGKGEANAENPSPLVADGDVRAACQQVCPTQAIVFGDLSDPASAVSNTHADDRAYTMLAELNIKPRNKYLARIRNPHPDLETGDHEHDGH